MHILNLVLLENRIIHIYSFNILESYNSLNLSNKKTKHFFNFF